MQWYREGDKDLVGLGQEGGEEGEAVEGRGGVLRGVGEGVRGRWPPPLGGHGGWCPDPVGSGLGSGMVAGPRPRGGQMAEGATG